VRSASAGAPAHHGELLQGVFRDDRGRTRHGLVTVPMHQRGTRATFTPDFSEADVTVAPADRAKARRAALLTLSHCAATVGTPRLGGHLALTSDTPVGLGLGSSTSDVVATVRAVAASIDVALGPDAVARLAARAEWASDPTMFDDRPLLFDQRHGHVLEHLGPRFPPLVVAGCVTGAGRPVDTVATAVDGEHTEEDLRAYERLRGLLRDAVARQDSRLLGRVATASARRHQRLRATPELDLLLELATDLAADGVQIAHSGNVAGLVFDPRRPDVTRRLERATAALADHGLGPTTTFSVAPVPDPSGGRPWTTTSARPSDVPTWSGSTAG
jgi:uncharacterized protein involved in propanediol utilization